MCFLEDRVTRQWRRAEARQTCDSQDTYFGRVMPSKSTCFWSELTRRQLNGRSGNTPGSRTALEEDGKSREILDLQRAEGRALDGEMGRGWPLHVKLSIPWSLRWNAANHKSPTRICGRSHSRSVPVLVARQPGINGRRHKADKRKGRLCGTATTKELTQPWASLSGSRLGFYSKHCHARGEKCGRQG